MRKIATLLGMIAVAAALGGCWWGPPGGPGGGGPGGGGPGGGGPGGPGGGPHGSVQVPQSSATA